MTIADDFLELCSSNHFKVLDIEDEIHFLESCSYKDRPIFNADENVRLVLLQNLAIKKPASGLGGMMPASVWAKTHKSVKEGQELKGSISYPIGDLSIFPTFKIEKELSNENLPNESLAG